MDEIGIAMQVAKKNTPRITRMFLSETISIVKIIVHDLSITKPTVMEENKIIHLTLDSGKPDEYTTKEPTIVSIGGHQFCLPKNLKLEAATPGSYYIIPLSGQFSYYGVIISGAAFIYSNGELEGNLGDEVLFDVIGHPKMKTAKASKGKEIVITSEGILKCEVDDLTENIQHGEKYLLIRDLKKQPTHPKHEN